MNTLCKWVLKRVRNIGRITTVKMSILPTVTYRFNAMFNKIPMPFFYGRRKKNSKIYMKSQKKKKPGGLTVPDFKLYYKAGHQTNMLNITNHQENANQNHNEVLPHTCQNGHRQKENKCWTGCALKGTLLHRWWECKLHVKWSLKWECKSHYGQQYGGSSKNTK